MVSRHSALAIKDGRVPTVMLCIKIPMGDRYPCYKVVSSKGKLSEAYAFGGIEAPKYCLMAEGIAVIKDHVGLAEYAAPLN